MALAGQGRPRRQGLDLFDSRHRWRSHPTAMPSPKALHRLRQFTDPKFDKNGKSIMTFGRGGSADGEFKESSCDRFRFARSLLCRPLRQQPRRHLRSARPMSAAWKPFGRPSGIWIEKNNTLYVTGSESKEHRARTRTRLQTWPPHRLREDGKARLLHPPPPSV